MSTLQHMTRSTPFMNAMRESSSRFSRWKLMHDFISELTCSSSPRGVKYFCRKYCGNRSRAAEMLGVSLRTVRNKIHGFGLPPKQSYRSANVEQDFDKNAGEKLCP